MRRLLVLVVAVLAVIAIGTIYPDTAFAQRRGGGGGGGGRVLRAPVVRGPVFVGGYFYDPFYGPYPWWGPGLYPQGYYPVYDRRADVRVLVTPREAAVYVDGFYSGIVDDFDGVFQSLPLSPGPHRITLYLDGFRTVEQNLYLTAGKSYKVRYTMQQLAAGERMEPAPSAPPVPAPPPGSAMMPRTPRPGGPPMQRPDGGGPNFGGPGDRQARGNASSFGTLALRVQPGDADVIIDGEKWSGSLAGERLQVQLNEGTHHVEITKSGYRGFSNEVTIRRGQTETLNVSLSSQ